MKFGAKSRTKSVAAVLVFWCVAVAHLTAQSKPAGTFTNPLISFAKARTLPPEAPRFHQSDGMIKTSAAWLIERAGFGKGFGDGVAQLSSKHTLALTNRGGATAADLLSLAREIRAGVQAKFGIELVPEPVLVGCEL